MKHGVVLPKLNKILKDRGIRIADLSAGTGIGRCTVSKYIKKGKCIDTNLNKIALFLKVDESDLTGKRKYYEPLFDEEPCLNKNCWFCKNKMCTNQVVLSGKAPCYGRK